MTRSLIIFIFMTLYSCSEKAPDKIQVRLQDSIATLTIPRLSPDDTLFSWVDKSDHHCGFLWKYRLQRKADKIVKESGFVKQEFPSADFYLTIEHSKYAECDSSFGIYREFPKIIADHLAVPYDIDSTRRLDGKRIYIFNYTANRSGTVLISDAVFEHKKRVIHLKFENRVNSRTFSDSIVNHFLENLTVH